MAQAVAHRFGERYWAVRSDVQSVLPNVSRQLPLWHDSQGNCPPPTADTAGIRDRAWLEAQVARESWRERVGEPRTNWFCELCVLEERHHAGVPDAEVACDRCGLHHRGDC